MPKNTNSRKSEPQVRGRVDQAHMRAANMGLILRHLRIAGDSSRARLATDSGLSKSTMSSVIAALVERGLVREGAPDRTGSVGRPGLMVGIDGSRVAGVGIEINVDYIALTAVDLAGRVIRESTTAIVVAKLSVEAVIDSVATLAARTLESLASADIHVVAMKVAVTGVLDYESGTVRFAPNLGWTNVAIIAELSSRLGRSAPPLQLESDAKFAAIAEYAGYVADGVEDLLYLTGDVGVGAGIIAGGRLIRGWSGFSGEVGHMPLDPEGHPCACGRRGCWETVVGMAALFRLVEPDDALDEPMLPTEERLRSIKAAADRGDERVLTALASITSHLADGLTILIDLLNPRVVVLGGYFSYFGDQILAPLAEALASRRMDEGSAVVLNVSQLGVTSASRGAAQAAIEDVYQDPTIVSPLV